MTEQNIRYYKDIKYWIKILRCHETKYVKIVYNVLYDDCLNHPNKLPWATLLRDLLSNLGFMDVLIQQNVGNENILEAAIYSQLSIAKKTLNWLFTVNCQ